MVLLGWAIAAGQAAGPYAVLDLGTLGGYRSEARDLNNYNLVVGTSLTQSNGYHGFLWRAGIMTDLGAVEPIAIGDDGHIVLIDQRGKYLRLYNGETIELAGLPNEVGLAAYKVNAFGTVAGYSTVRYPPTGVFVDRAIRWVGATAVVLGAQNGESSRAYGINDDGVAVGHQTINGGTISHAYIFYQFGGEEDIHGLANITHSSARAINEAGEVVGVASTRPFLWRPGGTMVELHTPGYSRAEALDINNSGVAVGWADGSAVMWINPGRTNESMLDLQNALPPGSGWDLDLAYAINDDGVIAGYGRKSFDTHGFLLYPTGYFARVEGRVSVLAIEATNAVVTLERTNDYALDNLAIELASVQGTNIARLGSAYTDSYGHFSFVTPATPTNQCSLKITLRDGANRVRVHDASRSGAVDPAWLRTPAFATSNNIVADLTLAINTQVPGDENEADYLLIRDGKRTAFYPTISEEDRFFEYGASNSGQDHFAHLAVIYRNTRLAARFAVEKLGLDMPPIPVRGFFPGDWEFGPTKTNHGVETTKVSWVPVTHFDPNSLEIVIADIDSVFNEPFRNSLMRPDNSDGNVAYWYTNNPATSQSGVVPVPNGRNRPDNREFHEYSHFIMYVSPIAGVNALPYTGDPEEASNHGGFLNPTSADSWTEGFAEFLSGVISAEMLPRSEKSWPNEYWCGGTILDLDGLHRNDEEFGIASVLWDLYDDAALDWDADRVTLGLVPLWSIFTANGAALGDFKALTDALNTFAQLNPATLNPFELTNHWAAERFFDDHWYFDGDPRQDDGRFEAGEALGLTSWNQAFLHRRHGEPPPGSYLVLRTVDGAGHELSNVTYQITIDRNPPSNRGTGTYGFPIATSGPVAIPIILPSDSSRARIRALKSGLPPSAELVVTSDFYQERTNPLRPGGVEPFLQAHTFTVGPTCTQQPVLARPAWVGGVVRLSFGTVSGCAYRVEFKDDLNAPGWTLLEVFQGDGAVHIAIDSTPEARMRFYRVRIE